MIKNIAEIAQEEYVGKNDLAQIDPATIMVIMELIQQIVEMFANCKKTPEQATAMSRNPSALQKMVLRSRIRREMGRFDQKMFDALLVTGTRVEEADMINAYSELGL